MTARVPDTRVAVFAVADDAVERATALSARYQLPRVPTPETDFPWLLQVSRDIVALRPSGAFRGRPFEIDLVRGELGYRLRHPGNEVLRRAVGDRIEGRTVLDCTAGLGRDALLLAARGARVYAVERHPAVCALLEDALARARTADSPLRDIARRVELQWASAADVLVAWRGAPPDVILLDPMFPARRGSALVKQPLRWLRALVGSDDDAAGVAAAALASAARRVIIKRPPEAAPLIGGPTYQLLEPTARLDVYVRP